MCIELWCLFLHIGYCTIFTLSIKNKTAVMHKQPCTHPKCQFIKLLCDFEWIFWFFEFERKTTKKNFFIFSLYIYGCMYNIYIYIKRVLLCEHTCTPRQAFTLLSRFLVAHLYYPKNILCFQVSWFWHQTRSSSCRTSSSSKGK